MAAESPRRTVVIDMGSNSFRLVAYSYVPGPLVAAHRRDLRHGADRRRPASPAAGSRRSGWSARSRRWRSTRTSARRAASPRPTCRRSRRARSATPPTAPSCSGACARATGLPARVLSSEEEAYYGYLAAVNSTTLRDGARARPRRRQPAAGARRGSPRDRDSASWPLGTVRMTRALLRGGQAGRIASSARRCARTRSRSSTRGRVGRRARRDRWSGSAAPCATSRRPRRRGRASRRSACRARSLERDALESADRRARVARRPPSAPRSPGSSPAAPG